MNSGALIPSMRAAIAEFRSDVVLRDPAEFSSALCAQLPSLSDLSPE